MRIYIYILILFFALGCQGKKSTSERFFLEDNFSKKDNSLGFSNEAKFPRNRAFKEFSDMLFSFTTISGLEFLQHTGRANEVDEKSLREESVLILDFQLKQLTHNILAHSSMNQDDLVKYFIGSIKGDVSFKQNSKTLFPNGVHYEGKVGAEYKVKVYFFIRGLDLSSPYELIYNDKAFDKGQIQLTFNNPYILG